MNLLQVRTQFVKISGRYDLVVDATAFADNGANIYIQAAQDMLERMVGTLPESEGRIWETIAIDAYYVKFTKRCRFIKEVWINDSEERSKLEKAGWAELRAYYNSIIGDLDSGTPLYYCPAKLRELDATDKNATGTYLDYSLADSKDYRGILLWPPTDEQIDVEILGEFYQTALSSDSDTNIWTNAYPDVLVKAAVYQAELFYASQNKTKGLLAAIMFDISEIEKDLVAEEVVDVDQIEG